MSELAKEASWDGRRERSILLAIVVIAIALRVAVALVHPFGFPDSKDYDALARALVEHRPYEVDGLFATRMPGYPLFIAGIYLVCGYSIKAVLVVQALLGGLMVYLTHRLARLAVGATRRSWVPLVAAGLVAFDPLLIAFSASLLTEVPFTVCLLAAIYLCARLLDRAELISWLAIALLWVVAVQLRASAYWCMVPLACVLIILAKTWRARLIHIAGLAIVFASLTASLLPWQNRNAALFAPAHVGFTTLEGISLYEAVYPDATGGPKQDAIPLPAEMQPLNEAQRNAEWSHRAWGYVRSEPGRMAVLAIRKIGRTWSPVLNAAEFQSVPVQVVLAAWYVPLFLLAIIGLLRRGLRRDIKVLLLVPILYFTAIHALFLGSVRYRVPLEPLICVLAAVGVAMVLQYGKPRPRSEV